MLPGIQLHTGQLTKPVFDVKNRLEVNKPSGCLWSSTYKDGRSAWVEWCEREIFRVPDVWEGVLLQPNPDARVYVIDSQRDADYLFEHYAMPYQMGILRFLDFESISKDYDAIHLTERGELETRNILRRNSLYGWDCECVCWFREAFTIIGRVSFRPNFNQKDPIHN
jgi:hypothetical protein